MDKLFDYLIIGFIIFSAISSVLKKKKPIPQKAEEEIPLPAGPDEDMLRWEQENSPSIPSNEYTSEEKPEEQTIIPPTFDAEYETRYIDPTKQKKLAEEVKEDEEKFTEKAEEFLESQASYKKQEKGNKIALTIRNKIHSEDYLKEFFVVSELLNKPLGLRDYGA